MLAIAAAVSRGAPLPMDDAARRPASVILMSAEDDTARVVVPRLKAAGANLNRIHLLESIIVPGIGQEGANPRLRCKSGYRASWPMTSGLSSRKHPASGIVG